MSVKKSLPRGALARAEKVLAALQARYPRPATHLEADNAWELLVATVLLPSIWLLAPTLATQQKLQAAFQVY